MKKSTAYYIKATILSVFLLVESFFLTKLIFSFVKEQKYFSPSIELLSLIALLLLLIVITNSLLSGAWDVWEQYVFSPLPIALGIFVVTFNINSAYAIIWGMVVYLIIGYDTFLATHLKSQMLVFNPRLILKFSSKGIILVYSITAAVLVIINSGNQKEINIGGTMGDIAEKYLTPFINTKIDKEVSSISSQPFSNLASMGLDPEQIKYVESTGLLNSATTFTAPKISLKNAVANEVNKLIEPYKNFINPVMGILAFGMVQFIGTIVLLVYMLTINAVFWIAKKSGFVRIEKVPAEREILTF